MNFSGFPCLPQTKRIWLAAKSEMNTYAEFRATFICQPGHRVRLQIACDSVYAVYLNGSLAAFSGCCDYPWYKYFDSIDLTTFCREQNEISIRVWYIGADSQTYLKAEPGLMFELMQNDRVLLFSDEKICSRRITNYQCGAIRSITPQLGYTFSYDNSFVNELPFENSREYPVWQKLVKRTAPQLRLQPRFEVRYEKKENGWLIDLGTETVGFLELDFVSNKKQNLLLAYGEHLVNGEVPRLIKGRDFSVDFIAAPGENRYLNPFRRLAGRYIQIFCESEITISYIGIRPVEVPVTEKKVQFADPLDQKIFDVSVNTLKKCMHEHYEDCPWREQAMYALDSRNQMLCGYEAFEGSTYQKQQLLLMAQGQRKDGLLPICFPAGQDFPIPFFSLVYLKILDEYIAYIGDTSVLDEISSCAHRLMTAFSERVEDNGLIADFPYPYWNFYEWADESNNDYEITRTPDDPYEKCYDIILNAMYVHAAEIYNRLFLGSIDAAPTKAAIQKTFYDTDKKCYKLSTSGNAYSVLGNSMALLIGLGDEALAKKLLTDTSLIPVTLSMNTFFYDALLVFGETFRKDILADLRAKYSRMLNAGAQTFWETEKGWQDFDNAGSLCHGWSAIPVYYLKKLV